MCKILERLKEYIDYKAISIAAFERSVGMSNASFSKQLKNKGAIGTDKLENILRMYEDLSPLWLMTGEGCMIKDNINGIDADLVKTDSSGGINYIPPTAPAETNVLKNDPYKSFELLMHPSKEINGIPLVSVQAVGGFSGKDFSIQERDIEAYYVIPKFRNLNVDFLIEVVGDSMMPRIFPGDIVACSIIRNPQFIQWNKTYLISSEEQGMIVKRLKKSNDKDSYLAVSDNLEYDPFDIPKTDIRGIARVVGVIHAE